MDKNKTLYGTDERSLEALLAQITPLELTTTCEAISVLSPEESGQLLQLDGSIDTLNVISSKARTGNRIRAIDAFDVDDPEHLYVKSHSLNGIWLAYDVSGGTGELYLGPRDSRTYIKRRSIPSRFIADLCACLNIGNIYCDYFYSARDLYLASSLNTVDSDGLFIFYLRDETRENVIRPFAAARGARPPQMSSLKASSADTLRQKEGRYRAVFDKAVDHAVRTLIEDVGDAYANDLELHRNEMYRYLHGETASYGGLVSVLHVNTSQLMVMSCTVHRAHTDKRFFTLLNPWTIDSQIFSDKKELKASLVSDITHHMAKTAFGENENFVFLLNTVCDGKRYIIAPDHEFISSLCHRLGCGRIDFPNSGKFKTGGHARCAYLASALSNNAEQAISLSVLPVHGPDGIYYRGIKASSAGNTPQLSLSDAYKLISRDLLGRSFYFRSWRYDKGSVVTVDFVLCDSRGVPILVPDIDKDIEIGIELQLSNGQGSAYRLCGIFYYQGEPFYAGATTEQVKKMCASSVIQSKRKTASKSLIKNLLSGFFDGVEHSDSGRKAHFPSPYIHLMEQAGLLKSEKGRSPFTGPYAHPRGAYNGSVMHLLETQPVEDIQAEILKFADDGYKTACAIARRVGKKKIAAAAGEKAGSGTMLDVFLALCVTGKEDKHLYINYRHETMTALGSYLAIYGYRRS